VSGFDVYDNRTLLSGAGIAYATEAERRGIELMARLMRRPQPRCLDGRLHTLTASAVEAARASPGGGLAICTGCCQYLYVPTA
jgi:hypothetical protein